jgi:hypothetical protein
MYPLGMWEMQDDAPLTPSAFQTPQKAPRTSCARHALGLETPDSIFIGYAASPPVSEENTPSPKPPVLTVHMLRSATHTKKMRPKKAVVRRLDFDACDDIKTKTKIDDLRDINQFTSIIAAKSRKRTRDA